MEKCPKHQCELKPLFTSFYCPRCEEEKSPKQPPEDKLVFQGNEIDFDDLFKTWKDSK